MWNFKCQSLLISSLQTVNLKSINLILSDLGMQAVVINTLRCWEWRGVDSQRISYEGQTSEVPSKKRVASEAALMKRVSLACEGTNML